MPKIINVERNRQLQHFVELLGTDRSPFVETGRKFDKVYVDGGVRYFVARQDIGADIKEGDIFGAKSKLAPNFRWFFGNLSTIDLWNWSAYHGKPEKDNTVMSVKGYGEYTHYKRISPTTN